MRTDSALRNFLVRQCRVWMGSNAVAWFGMVRRNGIRFSWKRLHIVALVFLWSLMNTFVGGIQSLCFGKALAVRRRRSGVAEGSRSADGSQGELDPLFVIGHWRSGTTLLHQLLLLDPRNTAPTCWECFAPHGCLLLDEKMAERFVPLWLPRKRPMDEVEITWEEPQEEEFALLNAGVPSPYEVFAFPNSAMNWDRYHDLCGLENPARMEEVNRELRGFISRVELRRSRESHRYERLILKSPPIRFGWKAWRRGFLTGSFCISSEIPTRSISPPKSCS